MHQLPGLDKLAFDKADRSPDTEFYREPRFVTHIDAHAIAAITSVYEDVLPPGGAILDLMSSWVSHLPAGAAYASVTGHGMNARELNANGRLSSWFVQDLNREPVLPLDTDTFDGACLCVSVQYLQRPVDVFREVARVLRPDSPFVVSFSNRCFPTKPSRFGVRSTEPTSRRWSAPTCGRQGSLVSPPGQRLRLEETRCG